MSWQIVAVMLPYFFLLPRIPLLRESLTTVALGLARSTVASVTRSLEKRWPSGACPPLLLSGSPLRTKRPQGAGDSHHGSGPALASPPPARRGGSHPNPGSSSHAAGSPQRSAWLVQAQTSEVTYRIMRHRNFVFLNH